MRAQAFTTGPNAGGYRLTRADIVVRLSSGTLEYAVSVRSDSAGRPGGVLATLTNPASLPSSGDDTFGSFQARGNGLDLEPNTTYWLVFEGLSSTGTLIGSFGATASTSEDAGAAAGWSIGTFATLGLGGIWSVQDRSMQITIHGEKRADPPATLAAPTVSVDDGTVLTVIWTAPENTAPAVTDYDVRYRRKGDAAWIDHPHTGTATTAAISDLLQGASWEAQVRATNSVGTGRWSAAGAGHTGPARFVRAETNTNGRLVEVFFTKDLESGHFQPHTLRVNNVVVPTARFLVGPTLGHSGIGMTLSKANAIQAGQTVTVSYARPAGVPSHRLFDADRQEVNSYTNQPVTNLGAGRGHRTRQALGAYGDHGDGQARADGELDGAVRQRLGHHGLRPALLQGGGGPDGPRELGRGRGVRHGDDGGADGSGREFGLPGAGARVERRRRGGVVGLGQRHDGRGRDRAGGAGGANGGERDEQDRPDGHLDGAGNRRLGHHRLRPALLRGRRRPGE